MKEKINQNLSLNRDIHRWNSMSCPWLFGVQKGTLKYNDLVACFDSS